MLPGSAPDDVRYEGFGGWLLLLCIGLFLGPIYFVSMSYKTYAEIQPYFSEYPLFFYTTIFQYVYFGTFMYLHIYTGIRLMNRKPSAATFAKKYFVIYAIGSLLSVAFPLAYGFPAEDTREMVLQQLKWAVQVCIFSTIWVAYLNKSKRVKHTYRMKQTN